MCVAARTHGPPTCMVHDMDVRALDFRRVSKSWLILVVEDVYETRVGIDTLLKATGYRVSLASAEQDVTNSIRSEPPNLILVGGAALPNNVLVSVGRIRKEATVGEEVPVVIFCGQDISEGEEVAIGDNVYLTNPDNFNQLRELLARLLPEDSQGDIAGEEGQALETYDK
jgi:CheY-like chemotaxis protein